MLVLSDYNSINVISNAVNSTDKLEIKDWLFPKSNLINLQQLI